MAAAPTTPFTYHVESFTEEEQAALQPYFTNLDRPVFALVNLPEVVKGALFARYSRSPKSVRRLFLDEFLNEPELGIGAIAEQMGPGAVDVGRAEDLYQKVFNQYGDDSVAQLGGVHLACEQASNILTKVLEWGRLAAYLEQSTRYMFYDQRLGDRYLADHVHLELVAHVLDRQDLQRSRPSDSGVVHQARQRASSSRHGEVRGRCDLVRIGDVALHGNDPAGGLIDEALGIQAAADPAERGPAPP